MPRRFLLLLLAAMAAAQTPIQQSASRPGRKWTTIQRLDRAHLEAVRKAREKFAAERRVAVPQDVYDDYRAVIHVHAEDADHTKGTRAQVLAAANKTGVRIVMWTDHRGPKPETWSGVRDGVLFIPGAEEDHRLRFPGAGELRFLSHLEERPEMPSAGYQGLEIYNRHADAKDEEEFDAWFKKAIADPDQRRQLAALQREFPDEVFAAGVDNWPELTARWDREMAAGTRLTGIAANDAHQNQLIGGILFDPYEVSFRNASTHILARELTEAAVRQSLLEGRAYVAHDWLCDPNGFRFLASNNLGVFEMGDAAPLVGTTRISAQTPVSAHLKLFHHGKLVAEATGSRLDFTAKETGAYRLEAWLAVDDEERPWIYSNAIHLRAAAAGELQLPSGEPVAGVEVHKDLTYVDGKPEDEAKHKLDVYLPAGRKNFPVFFFVHGGAWRTGDRSRYAALGYRFAREGIGVVIPSYRLSPANLHPAHIEDVAAAFAWTVRHIASHGGDAGRITIGGHSAGGHLVALLALDTRNLERHQVSPKTIRGVIPMSGVYNVEALANIFGADAQARREASPIHHVKPGAPPFLITYCQWDYLTLPAQARVFHAALQKAGVASELVYVPGESHISEIVNIVKEGDTTARAVLRLVR